MLFVERAVMRYAGASSLPHQPRGAEPGCALRAITFDMWGTIAEAPRSTILLRVAALHAHLPSLGLTGVEHAYDIAFAGFMRACEAGLGLPPANVLSGALGALGASLPPREYASVLRQWEEASLLDPPSITPGILQVLEALRGRGLAIGLISDTGVSPGRVLRQVLARAGLATMFDWLTFSDETGISKHEPLEFALTLRALGVAPDEALHVGDQPRADILGARAAGLRTALTLEHSRRREGIAHADIVLDHLSDLPAALTQRGW
jgi:putative hydrolase of the HAD superfamily